MKLTFRIVGADRDSGEDVQFVVEAHDEVEAETIAWRRNVLVHTVSLLRKVPTSAQAPPTPVPPRIERRADTTRPSPTSARLPAEEPAKQCPACKEWIHNRATKCPHCRSKQPPPPVGAGTLAVVIVVAVVFIVICSGILNSSSHTSSSDPAANPYFSSDEERLEWRSRNRLPMTDEDVKYEQRKIIEAMQKLKASEQKVGRD